MASELVKDGQTKALKPLRKQTKAALAKITKVDEYMEERAKANLPPTVESLCMWIGCSKDGLLAWAKGGDERLAPLADAYKRIKLASEIFWSDRLASSRSDQNAMFALKCRHRWVEEEKRLAREAGGTGAGVTIVINTGVPRPPEAGSTDTGVEIQVDNEAGEGLA